MWNSCFLTSFTYSLTPRTSNLVWVEAKWFIKRFTWRSNDLENSEAGRRSSELILFQRLLFVEKSVHIFYNQSDALSHSSWFNYSTAVGSPVVAEIHPAEIHPALFHPPKSTRRFPPKVSAVFHPAEIHPCHFPPRTFSTRPKSTQHQNWTSIPMIRGFLSNHWNANWFGFEIYWLDDLIHDSVHFPYGTFLRLDQDKLG